MERLTGEVPFAVSIGPRTCGGHNLSRQPGQCRPGPAAGACSGLTARSHGAMRAFAFRRCHHGAVVPGPPTSSCQLRIPDAAAVQDHGQNEVQDLRPSARGPRYFQAASAREAGAYVLTETSAGTPASSGPTVRVVGLALPGRQGPRQGRRSRWATFRPAPTSRPALTVPLARGCWGHLNRAANPRVRSPQDREPQGPGKLGRQGSLKVP